MVFAYAVIEGKKFAEQCDRMLVTFFEIATNKALSLNDYVLNEGVIFLWCHCLGQCINLFEDVTPIGFAIRTKHFKGCPALFCSLTLKDMNVEISKFGDRKVKIAAAVWVFMQQVCTCPIEHRHKVIADDMNAFSRQIA